MECTLCPRMCRADRVNSKGYCQMPDSLYLARSALHMWEEPCISGKSGSGTVFFSGCTLRCVFCQNYKIAAGGVGKEVTVGRLSEIFLELQNKGAHNINLVTPTHYSEKIAQAIKDAKDSGLNIPIVYNTSGYESVESLKALEGLIDIYMPDFKYMSSEYSLKYSNAADYSDVAKKALAEMFRQVKKVCCDSEGMMKSGMLVRHLILPGLTKDSKSIIKYLYETYGDDICISIMNQYTPLPQVEKYPEINRRVTKREYEKVVSYALDIGVVNAFIQDGRAAKESFIPEFDCYGVV